MSQWSKLMKMLFHRRPALDRVSQEIERVERELRLESMESHNADLATEVAHYDPHFRVYARRVADARMERESRMRALEAQKDVLLREANQIQQA